MREISKEEFKKSIIENVKNQYRRTIDEATPQQIFQAVSYAIKDVIIDDWIATQKQFDETGAKKVYYLSMEFLMGRALGNNIINLGAKKAVKEALEELGFDLNAIEDQEPDPALGNGGLGRLAACFLDSLATLGYPAYGCGIRYHYGMFKQKIKDGYQVEVLDERPAQPTQPTQPQQTKEQYQAGIQLGEWQSRAGAAMRRANALGFQISEIKAQAREEYGVDIADMDVQQLQAFCAELEGTLAAFEAAE